MNIPKYSLENQKIIYFFLAVMLIGGIYSFFKLPKKEDSPFVIKTAVLVTQYPGATPQEVEKLVTEPIEREIQAMSDVFQIKSESYFGMSKISIELQPTLSPDYMPVKWDELRRKVANIQPRLPSGASSISVSDDFGDVFGIYYALTADEGYTYDDLRNWAQKIKTELSPVPGVQKVYLFGEQTQVVNVKISVPKLANLGIDPNAIQQVMQTQNLLVNTGDINTGNYQLRLRAEGTYKDIQDIRDQLIVTKSGGEVRLGDIATVERGYMDPPSNLMRVDGKRAIGIGVATGAKDDVVAVGNVVADHLKEMGQLFPIGMDLKAIYPENKIAQEANNGFILNLIESLLIVIVIIFIVMGSRAGMLVGSSLLFSVGGTLLIMLIWGVGLNRTSLAAFIIAMGMLVDNAIVIIDGILVDLKAGKSRMEAMTAIGRQTAMPLLGATLIAIIAFLPIFMSPDTAGVYTRDLFIVLAVSLLLSWVLALVHVPLMANRILHPDVSAATATTGKRVYEGKIYAVLRSLLRFSLAHRWSFVFAMIALVVLSGFSYRFMKQGFFPDMVYDQLYMEYKLPEGINSTRVARDLEEIEAYLKKRPEITHVTTSIGGTPARYNLVRNIANPSLSYGELIIDFTSPDALVDNMAEIQQYLSSHYPDAYVKLNRYNLMFKKYPIEAQFTGPDPAVLHQLADSARKIMENCPDVCLITTDWEPQVPVLTIEYDQPTARAIGLSRNDVSLSLLTATSGIPIGSFYEGIHKDNIYLRCLDEHGKPIENLDNTQIFSSLPSLNGLLTQEMMMKLKTGTLSKEELVETLMGTTPLKQISKRIDIRWEDPVVPRYNGQRSQRVQCSPAPGIETEKARQIIARRIEQIELPQGYTLHWQGEKSASDESMEYLFKNFPLAIILMIAILIMLFKDYRKPAIILCCVPLLAIGIVGAMLLSGQSFTFCAIVGALGLVGMMMKNCIVLMDEIGEQISAGIAPAEALVSSSESRLRPVMMASLTTILGMIPLLSDAMFGSMAATIMGGLLFSTLATLFFVPILYAMFFKIKIK